MITYCTLPAPRKQRYSSSSYNGGIKFTKDMINSLPWVELPEADKTSIVNLVDKIIEAKDRTKSVKTAPSEGLYLKKVWY